MNKANAMSAENRRILIIDDERPILLTLEALLGRHGYQPETAATASYGSASVAEKSARRRLARSATAGRGRACKCSIRSSRSIRRRRSSF